MARDKQPFEALSETAEKTVGQNMEKARGAIDNYFSFLQNILSSNDLTEKRKTYISRGVSNSDRVHAGANEFVCRTGQVSRRGVYQSGDGCDEALRYVHLSSTSHGLHSTTYAL